MTQDYHRLITEAILNPEVFVRATFSGRLKGQELRWQRVTIRPVLIKDVRHLQFSYYDETKHITQNYSGEDAEAELHNVLALPFRNFHVVTTEQQIQVNLSKKGKPFISVHANETPQAPDLSHDREKNRILAEGVYVPYLHAIGIMTEDGRIKAGQRDKFKQINEFLRLLQETNALTDLGATLHGVDFGCGSAALTFATYHYMNEVLGIPTRMVGVDVKGDLIARHNQTAQALGWEGLIFEHTTIADYQPEHPPELVIALHACDTATDDAIAQGIRWGSRIIVCAPCCHHDLQAQLEKQNAPAPFTPVLRYGLFHERLGDVLTDTFRTLLLRAAGYKTDVVEFVAAEHTPRNVMIRAVKVAESGGDEVWREYEALRDYWGVVPYLEKALND